MKIKTNLKCFSFIVKKGINKNKSIAYFLLILAITIFSGCVPPPSGRDYNGGSYRDRGGYDDQRSYSVNVTGNWYMRNGSYNRIKPTYEGMLVTPVGRGKARRYIKIGDNLYKDAHGTGTYEFVYTNKAIWHSNDKRNKTIVLWKR